MDIWNWVDEAQAELIKQKHHRLALLMDLLPHYTNNEYHAEMDAIVPEALALARALKSPWIEVFIRHWNLQSRVLHRHEITEMLPEAVSLLEFANRDDTRDCPQSICAVQDITSCYGQADGPGYVEERLSIAKEALEKIDATWACFSCISEEYAAALLDGKRYEEALSFLEQPAQALLLTKQYRKYFNIRGKWVEALIRLQRYEEAYAFNKEGYLWGDKLTQTLEKALITAYLGRYDDAERALPNFEKIVKTPNHYVDWAEAARLLAEAAVIRNDWHLNAKFQSMCDRLSHHGIIRKAFTIALWQADLALKRGQTNTASRCCDRAEALIPRLRKPLDAPEVLEEMRSQILSQQSVAPFSFETPEQVLENLGENPESNVDILEKARQKWPEHEELALSIAKAYEMMGEPCPR
jgi:tetratricopeptide (TPR) repeat protein